VNEGQTTTIRVVLAGDFDIANRDRLEELLRPALSARSVVLDLSKTTYMDSSALTCLLTFNRDLNSNGGHFVIKHVPRTIRRVLEITHLDEIFDVE
jgi:anti-anti-sigma factor